MAVYWNGPPGWPTPPTGWLPPAGWRPPAHWPAAPSGWVFLIEVDDSVPAPAPARRQSHRGAWVMAATVAVLALVAGALVGRGLDPRQSAEAVAPQATVQPAAPMTPAATAPAEPAPAISVQAPPSPNLEVFAEPVEPARPPDFPPPGVGEQPRRLLAKVPFNGSSDWAAMTTNPDGSAAGFSPCRQWQVVVNLAGAPAGAYDLVAGVVATVRQATGVAFVLEGTTDEPASAEATRRAYQPERYGERWAPILIGWAPSTAENAAGQGGPQGVTESETGLTHYVTGFVAIDPDGSSNSDPVTLRAILLHELAHVVGLNHVPDPTQLMAPVYQDQREFQRGDLAGLAAVGSGSCSPDL